MRAESPVPFPSSVCGTAQLITARGRRLTREPAGGLPVLRQRLAWGLQKPPGQGLRVLHGWGRRQLLLLLLLRPLAQRGLAWLVP